MTSLHCIERIPPALHLCNTFDFGSHREVDRMFLIHKPEQTLPGAQRSDFLLRSSGRHHRCILQHSLPPNSARTSSASNESCSHFVSIVGWPIVPKRHQNPSGGIPRSLLSVTFQFAREFLRRSCDLLQRNSSMKTSS